MVLTMKSTGIMHRNITRWYRDKYFKNGTDQLLFSSQYGFLNSVRPHGPILCFSSSQISKMAKRKETGMKFTPQNKNVVFNVHLTFLF